MATLTTTRTSPFTNSYTAEVPPAIDTTERQRTLRQYLVAREKVRFFEEYARSQQQQHLDDFVLNFMAKRMYSTSCDHAPAASGEIKSACVAFNAEANALKATVVTLGAVRERLDEHIATHVGLCGHDAACILEDHISRVQSELSVTQTKRDDVKLWLGKLQTLRTHAQVRDEANDYARTAGVGFGVAYTPTVNVDDDVTETITEEYRREGRVAHDEEPFQEPVQQKPKSKR